MQKYLTPIAILVAGLLIGGAIVYTQGSQRSDNVALSPETSQKESTKVGIEVKEQDHIRGNVSAQVTIVEFSDLQCPFCQSFHPTVKQILADYPDQVRWVYKHFPLDAIHPEARPAAEASECVAEQKGNEGFFEFADALFENQSSLGGALYRQSAQGLSLNMNQFDNCLSSRKYKDKVEADYQEGIKAGVRGTPTSFVNGELVPGGAVSYQTLKAAVERALNEQ